MDKCYQVNMENIYSEILRHWDQGWDMVMRWQELFPDREYLILEQDYDTGTVVRYRIHDGIATALNEP